MWRLSLIFFLFIVWLARFGCINSNGQSKTFLRLSISTPLASVFFLLPSLVKSLNILKTVRRDYLLSLRLKFFNPKVFHKAVLALSGGGIGWPSTLKIILICLTRSVTNLECRLGLSVNYFCISL